MTVTFEFLKKSLGESPEGLPRVKAALAGDFATQLLAQALAGAGRAVCLDLAVDEAGPGQEARLESGLPPKVPHSQYDFVLLASSPERLLERFYRLQPGARAAFADSETARLAAVCEGLLRGSARRVMLFNFPVLDDGVFGNFSNKTEESFLFQARMLNAGLMRLAAARPSLYICDAEQLLCLEGSRAVFDRRNHVAAGMPFSLDFLARMAVAACGIISSACGGQRKLLALDLDNTLWGGAVGDAGVEGIELGGLGAGRPFSELQAWALELKRRGVVLAVCSKNTEEAAMEPFERHPEMLLRKGDISYFAANWDSKPDNLLRISEALGVAPEAMVFVDDDPAERALVREELPAVAVPELPVDPADHLPFLRGLALFETPSLSPEDAGRADRLRAAGERAASVTAAADEQKFLEGLRMSAAVSAFGAFNAPRVAQLTQRSNQFNLRTSRYTQEEVLALAALPGALSFAFTLEDRFGDYGLVAAAVLTREGASPGALFLDAWVMSCRAHGRGLEALMMNTLAAAAASAGAQALEAEYIPSPRNAPLKELLPGFGFSGEGARRRLTLEAYAERPHKIRERAAGGDR